MSALRPHLKEVVKIRREKESVLVRTLTYSTYIMHYV